MATDPINDYYVITSLRVGDPDRWSWEIGPAQFAGKQALAEFLAALLKEEERPGK